MKFEKRRTKTEVGPHARLLPYAEGPSRFWTHSDFLIAAGQAELGNFCPSNADNQTLLTLLLNLSSITNRLHPSISIMSPGATNGEAEVGSDGPRQKGKATPDTLKYVQLLLKSGHVSHLTNQLDPQNRMHRPRYQGWATTARRDSQHKRNQEWQAVLLQL